MLTRVIILLVVLLVGVVALLVTGLGEDFAEKLLPFLFVLFVVAFLSLSWYLGYFFATHKPSSVLIVVSIIVIIIAGVSGYYIGSRGA